MSKTELKKETYGTVNNVSIDSNAVTSVFAKENILSQLKDAVTNTVNGKTELFYWNKKEALALLQGAGLQLPGGLPQDGFVHSIRDVASKVKHKFENVTQQRISAKEFVYGNDSKKLSKNDDIFYDINLEVDQILPHTNGASEIKRSTSINKNISQNNTSVNTYSMKNSGIL